ncbi:alpha,alpha-trehalase TreF [Rhodocytophaga aerolata]|uniref:Alpha,alpha-trehalase TreF n=1 Tax=Rhodocytophaga aerolata TaxID=455078 RepID=A0ABT8RH27_9BACT|nr:alpha,alpha-trehalase TreF [Rhodocytophaga aerolata]MDO1450463.1 alpha,alpha-trehalase TreF [Rhodocytophaga aerolata]
MNQFATQLPPQIYSVVPAILPPDQLFGPLFHDAQMRHVFEDSITFADCYPRRAPEEILSLYEIEKHRKDFRLKDFVHAYFHVPEPVKIDHKSDRSLATADHLHQLWPLLVQQSETNCSLLPLPEPYIVPGGRFRGLYYWDSYFTMLGLRVSGNYELIRQMVKNFAYLIDAYGHIPNANRSYYLTRSQPPFFALMVQLLADIDGPQVLQQYLPHMQKEYNYWMDGYFRLNDHESSFRRVVMLPDGSILNRYWDDLPAPRPESYREDVELAHKAAPYGVSPGSLYRHIRAACESGWDFSCRWLGDEKNLATIHTTDIIPVDLNCLLYYLEMTLSTAYTQSSFEEPGEYFKNKADRRRKAMQTYFWDTSRCFFMDYNAALHKPTSVWSLAGVFPLFFGIATPEQAGQVQTHLEKSFLKSGGLVSSLQESGQQWDSPNGWAPMQWIAHQGLLRYNFSALAAQVRQRWMSLNDQVFRDTGKMMEKYNVVDTSIPAGGGEYPNQDGFGWTNGVYLCLQTHERHLH